jgi:hypothetical protein
MYAWVAKHCNISDLGLAKAWPQAACSNSSTRMPGRILQRSSSNETEQSREPVRAWKVSWQPVEGKSRTEVGGLKLPS